jgi:ABC-type proline/glycine betaine transport system permease subunit
MTVTGYFMLTLTAVATTDGGTSLHSPLFVVGLTVVCDRVAAAVGDTLKVKDDRVANETKPAVVTRYRISRGRRTWAD